MIQEQQDVGVTETMFCFIVQYLSICDAETAEHEGDEHFVLLQSSVVKHL